MIQPGQGVLPSQTITRMLAEGQIKVTHPVPGGQVQPASLDLRLSNTAWRVRASFLPGRNRTVAERLADLDAPGLVDHRDLAEDLLADRDRQPLSGGQQVTMYSCGPTVHRRPHIGVLRRMLADDLVRRSLEFAGYEVNHVVSITDLDDNTLAAAEARSEPMDELTRRYEAAGELPAHTRGRLRLEDGGCAWVALLCMILGAGVTDLLVDRRPGLES